MAARGTPDDPARVQRHAADLPEPEHVAILQEMSNNDVRIVPLDGRPHLPSSIRQWPGDSRGRWEGDTLVVDTINFNEKTHYQGSSEALHVVERFTRVDAETIRYEFTVEDPTSWTRPWSAELPLMKREGPLFEYGLPRREPRHREHPGDRTEHREGRGGCRGEGLTVANSSFSFRAQVDAAHIGDGRVSA